MARRIETSIGWAVIFILNCHKNCLVFVTMTRKFEPQSPMGSDLASVCGRRAGKWSGERRGAPSETKPERNARRRAADGSPLLLRRPAPDKLVTSVQFAKRNGRGRQGNRADCCPEAEQTARWSRRKPLSFDFGAARSGNYSVGQPSNMKCGINGLNDSNRFVFPGRKAQGVLMASIIGKLRNSFDEILLVGLAQGKAVEPPLATELVKAGGLP